MAKEEGSLTLNALVLYVGAQQALAVAAEGQATGKGEASLASRPVLVSGLQRRASNGGHLAIRVGAHGVAGGDGSRGLRKCRRGMRGRPSHAGHCFF